jgi:hypothetical protein
VDLDPLARFFLAYADPWQMLRIFGAEWESIVPEAWACHGESIVAEWIARRPCSRPRLWWALDAPDGRPILNPAPAAVEAGWREQYELFGRPCADIWHGHGQPSGVLVEWLESQERYLKKMGLLTRWETRLNGECT